MSHDGGGASKLAARHPVPVYGGHGREPTVVWGTECQGPESILHEARSDALILMGDWCDSGDDVDTVTREHSDAAHRHRG